MKDQEKENKPSYTKNIGRNLLVSVSAGCLTMTIAGLSLIGGLLIDACLGTAPKWTLILLLASAPFALGGVYLIVRRALKKAREEGQQFKKSEQEQQEEE